MAAKKRDAPDPAEVGSSEALGSQFPHPPTALTCPDCGGTLWEFRDGELLRYRCHVGHAYSPESLLTGQGEKLEIALWTALRALEEAADLSRRMSRRAEERGNGKSAGDYEQRAVVQISRANVIRELLTAQRGAEAKAMRTAPADDERDVVST